MVAEVATFLVSAKLHNILTHEEFVVLGLRRNVEHSLEKIQQLSVFLKDSDLFQGKNDDVSKAVTAIYQLEAAIDLYLRKRVQGRKKFLLMGSRSSFQYLLLRPLWNQMELGKGILKFMNNVKEIINYSEITVESDSSFLEHNARIDSWENIKQSLDTESSMTVDQIENVRSLVSKLTVEKQGDLHALCMVGSGGSGKTEVVRHVYNKAEVKNHFDLRAWVWLSRDSTCRDILVELILQATMTRSTDLDHKKNEELGEILFKLLMDKRYLIVLDDFRAYDSWHGLAVAFPDFGNGSRVVVTTRSTKIPQLVDPLNPPFELYPLTIEESWKLLLKQVSNATRDGVEKRDDETLSRLKQQVLIKTRGLAIATGLLGGLIYNEESTRWEEIISNIPSSDGSPSTEFNNILSLSFRTLPPMLKSCLIYLSVFPMSFEVPVRRLLRLWQAEGFLDIKSLPISYSTMELEDLAELCLKVLINRKLVEVTRWKLNGNPKTCRMPSLVHEFFHPQSVHMRFCSIYPQRQIPLMESLMQFSSSQRLAHYSGLKDNDKSGSCTDHLYSFLSFDTSVRGTPNTEIGSFFKTPIDKERFALLKLIDLEGVYKPILPDAMGRLLLLKFLGLRSTVLDSVPSWIGNLPLLETLDLKHTNVTTLPKSIWKSKKLRHLYVEEVRLDGSCQKITGSSLSNLQALGGFLIVDKKVVRNILKRLLNLRKVGITCQTDSMDAVAEWILQQPQLESLKLTSIDRFGKPSEFGLESLSGHQKLCSLYLLGPLANPLANFLPQCIRKLTLSMSKFKDDPMEVLGELPELTVLRLLSKSYIGRDMTCSNGKFLNLRSLKVWMLEHLNEWTIEEGAMPCLQELELRRCNQLSKVSGLEYLSSLKDLHLTNMDADFVENTKKSLSDRILHVCVNDWKFSYTQEGQQTK